MRAATRPSCGCKAAETNLAPRRGRGRAARRPDRRAQAPGAPGGPLPQRLGRGAQGRGDAVIICAGSAPTPRSREAERAKDLSVRARRRGHHRPEPRPARAARPRRRRAAAARSRGARRRRAAAPGDRARHARRRGNPRPRAPRRARPAARAVRGGRRARAHAGRRRRSGAGAARAGRSDAAQRGARRAPSAAPASMPRAAEADSRRRRGGKDLRRTDRRARRPHRAAQPAHRRPRASSPSASPGSKARSPISRPALPPSRESRPDRRGARGRGRRRAGRGRRRPSRPRSPPKPRTARRARISMPRACRSPTPSARCSASTPKPRRLMKLLAVETKSMWPPVIDKITVEKGYEIALGAALGDDLEAPVDQRHAMRWTGAAIDPSDPALPEGARAARAIRAGAAGAGAPARPDRRGRRAPTARGSPALLKPGQRLVSRDGDLWRWDGFAADAHAPTGAARRLAAAQPPRRHRRANSSPRAATLEDKRKAAEAAQAELTAAGAAEAAAREHWREAQREADNARELHAMAEREMARNAARISALTEAKTRLIAGRDEAQAAARDRRAGARRAAAVGRSGTPARRHPRRDRGQARRSSPRCAPRRRRWRARPSSPTAASTPSAPTGRPGATATTAPSPRSRRSTPAAPRPSSERASLADAPAIFAEKRRAADRRDPGGRSRPRAPPPTAWPRPRTRSPPADRAVRAALEALGAAREEAARAEERVEGAKRRLTDIAHEIREMLEVEPDAVAALAGIEPDDSAAGRRRRSKTELERLRRERERLGAVNLRAEEELGEIEAQHTTLDHRARRPGRGDRAAAPGHLSLNREARERLLSSFAIVNAHFQRLFTELFGGGTAELQLIESDDPLEAGLEIFAKPPGKKPATLSLLSGGEQALTALALIFAVFLTNPAPICVLDEVDAPLDDHNVERFCDLLDEMSALDRHPLRHHHPQSDHHGADEPAVRRHHGRARHLAARLGRSRSRGEDQGLGGLARRRRTLTTPLDLAAPASAPRARPRWRVQTCSSPQSGHRIRPATSRQPAEHRRFGLDLPSKPRDRCAGNGSSPPP